MLAEQRDARFQESGRAGGLYPKVLKEQKKARVAEKSRQVACVWVLQG